MQQLQAPEAFQAPVVVVDFNMLYKVYKVSRKLPRGMLIQERISNRIKNWIKYAIRMEPMLNIEKSFLRLKRSLREEIAEHN